MLEEMKRVVGGGGNHERELGAPLVEMDSHVAHLSDLSSLQGRELERGFNSNTSIGKKNQNNSSETNLFTHLSIHLFTSKKAAFTLAEVLITLGIIGVVAAITMPVLLSNVQDRVKQKRVENIKQKLSKVTDKMAVQSGLIGYGDTMSFVQEMSKHMKLAKICDNNHLDSCWPTKEVDLNKDGKTWEIAKTKNAKTLKINKEIRDNWADTVGIVTADGVAMILSYDKTCDFDVDKSGLVFNKNSAMSNSMGCLSGVFDWNGGKNPNKLGEDILTFGLAAGLGTECAFELDEKCFTAPSIPTPLTVAECESEKDKLGIKECCTDNMCYGYDSWAGAVKQCGGVSKMPTADDLAKLATLLYGGKTIGAYEATDVYDESIILNTSIAASMGFTGSEFYIWSGEELGSSEAYGRYFYSSSTDLYGGRRNRGLQVICSGD